MTSNRFQKIAVLVLIAATLGGPNAAAATSLKGSGASFPYEIYSLWFMLAARADKELQVDYTPKGSGSGIRDFQNHAVDFAASDAAMNEEEIAKVGEEVQLLPMTAGEVVLAYNLKGINELRLPRTVYPAIFLGKIKKWNDPAIASANPGVVLPDLEITVVTRVESSGTNFVFTKHLSAISEDFRNGPGYGKLVDWPAALKIEKAPLNAGLAATVKNTPGAIGYLDYGFAKIAGLSMAKLQNKQGLYIAPRLEGGQAALASVGMPDNMIAWPSDPDGEKSYPITTYTWMLFYKHYADPEKARTLRSMINYCLDKGQKISDKFGYVPLPRKVVEKVRSASARIE